jgi:sulfofructose kinase
MFDVQCSLSVMTKQWDVLALGNTAVDDLLYVPHFPAPDTKMQVLSSQRQCGGLAATAIVAASRLGATTAYAGALGDDELSRLVEATLTIEGVDTTQVVNREDARPIHSRIIVGQDGSRNIFYEVGGFSGADENEPPEGVILAARVLLVDRWGVEGMLRAMKIARAEQIPVVGDIERSDFEGFEDWLEWVDHLIVPEGFACKLTGASDPAQAARKLWTSSRAVVAVTGGEAGCWVLTSENEDVQHFPAFKVEAVDTTGCGDVFHGAYAAALAQGQEIADCIRFAAAAAALKATKPGGQSGIPTRVEVEEFLKSW